MAVPEYLKLICSKLLALLMNKNEDLKKRTEFLITDGAFKLKTGFSFDSLCPIQGILGIQGYWECRNQTQRCPTRPRLHNLK